MADINTIIEEAQLMKQNRVDLVKALNEIGFTQVNDQTPLSDIAKYMKWAAGLLDIRLATFSKSTKQHRYWTYDEWVGQSAQTRSFYIQMGVVIRAERQEFIIAKDNLTSDSGSTAMQWATNNNNDVRGLTNFYGVPTMLTDIDGEANTDLILAAISTTRQPDGRVNIAVARSLTVVSMTRQYGALPQSVSSGCSTSTFLKSMPR